MFLDCKFDDSGTSYSGSVSVTISGKTCQRWDGQRAGQQKTRDPRRFPDQFLTESSNYCRNPDPDGRPAAPWCFTDLSREEWEYCSVPFCGS